MMDKSLEVTATAELRQCARGLRALLSDLHCYVITPLCVCALIRDTTLFCGFPGLLTCLMWLLSLPCSGMGRPSSKRGLGSTALA